MTRKVKMALLTAKIQKAEADIEHEIWKAGIGPWEEYAAYSRSLIELGLTPHEILLHKAMRYLTKLSIEKQHATAIQVMGEVIRFAGALL